MLESQQDPNNGCILTMTYQTQFSYNLLPPTMATTTKWGINEFAST
jgi:hypothetical protein